MTHTSLPPIAPPSGVRPADAAPRVHSAFWRQAARKAPPRLEEETSTDRQHGAVNQAARETAAGLSRSPMKVGSQSSLPSLRSGPLSPATSQSVRALSSSLAKRQTPQAEALPSAAATALGEEEFRARVAITTTEGLNRMTFNLVQSRSAIIVLEEPAARRRIEALCLFGSCQIRLTQVIKIQAWWRLLLRHRKSWHAYAHGALRVWRRRVSETSRVSSSVTTQSNAVSRRQSQSQRSSPPSRVSSTAASPTAAIKPATSQDIAEALERLEKAATSPLRYNTMMDEYIYSLRARAEILLLLERRRSAERHKMLYYNYVEKCNRGIPEDNLAWQERFVAEMFVAITHFKFLPYSWRTRYKMPYPAWRVLRWRTPRIAAPPVDTAAEEQARRQQRQRTLAALNDLVSLCDHERMELIGQEHRDWQSLQKAFQAHPAAVPHPPTDSSRPVARSGAKPLGKAEAPKPLDKKALTPLPPARALKDRTLPPLNDSKSTRPQTTRAHRPLLPPPRGRPAWATVPLNSTPMQAAAVPETELDLAVTRLRQEEKDARSVVENQEYDGRYRVRWLYATTRPKETS